MLTPHAARVLAGLLDALAGTVDVRETDADYWRGWWDGFDDGG